MDEEMKKLLEKKKMQELQKMEEMGQEENMSLSQEDMDALDINKRLAKGVELERQKEIEDKAVAKKQEEQAIAEREAQGEQEYQRKLKEKRKQEYMEEIAKNGYADKADYPELFPQEEIEISPMQLEEEKRKRLGYK